MNSKLLLAGIIWVFVAIELGGITLTTGNNAYTEWIIPSQLSQAYKNAYNNTTSAVSGQHNHAITTMISTENSSSEGK
jgi:hypothetical protein